MKTAWNHNLHYHPLVLSFVPRPCRRALDVGCGQGILTRQLAPLCDHVTGIDLDPATLSSARTHTPQPPNIDFIAADALTHPLPGDTFDFIATIATLHHLPLADALKRFHDLLAPGGVLVVIGLYRPSTLSDFLHAAAARPASWILRHIHRFAEVSAPVQEPRETLSDIRRAAHEHLHGAVLHRRLFFRYSLHWHKP